MARYIAITSATTTTLIEKNGSIGGAIRKITICNNSANAATGVHVNLWDGSSETLFHFCRNVTIPSGATLVLDDNLAFDKSVYKLRISNAGTDPDITVIIK